jgi:hypothetical protein
VAEVTLNLDLSAQLMFHVALLQLALEEHLNRAPTREVPLSTQQAPPLDARA